MGQDGGRRGLRPVTRKITGFLLHPAQAFRDVREEPVKDSLWYYAILLLTTIALTIVVIVVHSGSMAAKYPTGYHPPVLPIISVIFFYTLLLATLGFGIAAIIFHVLVSVCSGIKGLEKTVTVLLHAATTLLLAFWILVALALYQSPAGFPVLIAVILWTVALTVIGLRELHEISVMNAVKPFLLATVLALATILMFTFVIFPDPCGGMCSHVAAVTTTCSGTDILVTYQGGTDASSLVNITVTINGEERSPRLGGMTGTLPVGSAALYTGPFLGRNHVVAIAYFNDGAQQVILDAHTGCGTGPDGTTRSATTAARAAPSSAPVSVVPAYHVTVQPVVTARDPHDTLCARVRFDPIIAGCCADTMYLINQSVCCGGKLYDNATTGCCSSRPYDYTTQDCCGNTVYDQNTSYCCNNRVTTGNCDWAIADINVTGVRMTKDASGAPAIAGTIVNNGTVTYTSVTISLACYDAKGTRIDSFMVGSVPGREGVLKGGYMVQFGRVKDGGSMEFLIPARNPATKTMKILSIGASYVMGPDMRGSIILSPGYG